MADTERGRNYAWSMPTVCVNKGISYDISTLSLNELDEIAGIPLVNLYKSAINRPRMRRALLRGLTLMHIRSIERIVDQEIKSSR